MTDSRRILLISYPRSASNLLVQMLALDDQSHVSSGVRRGYHFRAMAALPREENWWAKPLSKWGNNVHRLRQAAEDGFAALDKTRAVGDMEGKITFVKEHIAYLTDPNVLDKFLFGDDGSGQRWRIDQLNPEGLPEHLSALNDTMFSAAYLRQWKKAFLIRHPVMAFPSLYRLLVEEIAGEKESEGTENFFPVYMTLRWNRRLYDLATSLHDNNANSLNEDDTSSATWPIVLDADDVMANPVVVEKFAAIMGMDPGKVQTTWASLPEEQREKMPPRAQRMMSTLNASTGIILEKSAANVRIEDEVEQWKQEFGDAGAHKLEKWVRAAMPDYEYLWERRLRL